MTKQVEALAERVKRMSTADKLRLAAGLIDRDKRDVAEDIAEIALQELQAARLFGKAKRT